MCNKIILSKSCTLLLDHCFDPSEEESFQAGIPSWSLECNRGSVKGYQI